MPQRIYLVMMDETEEARAALRFAARRAVRTGGTRTSSPSARRVSAAARPLLMRTSPERITR